MLPGCCFFLTPLAVTPDFASCWCLRSFNFTKSTNWRRYGQRYRVNFVPVYLGIWKNHVWRLKIKYGKRFTMSIRAQLLFGKLDVKRKFVRYTSLPQNYWLLADFGPSSINFFFTHSCVTTSTQCWNTIYFAQHGFIKSFRSRIWSWSLKKKKNTGYDSHKRRSLEKLYRTDHMRNKTRQGGDKAV